jgi:hypothetical protein
MKSLLLLFLFFPLLMNAQTVILSGRVTDNKNGQALIGAAVFDAGQPTTGVLTDADGYFQLELDKGTYTITASYIGYDHFSQSIALSENTTLNIQLKEAALKLATIDIVARRKKSTEDPQMSQVTLSTEQAQKLPALLGEVDVLKTIQLLPGVVSGNEGSSGFYVRGGGPDQNLVLLDDAVVYNPGHMLGFFSVFNADVIESTDLYKGNMPAAYGGRLSSVVDIGMKKGRMDACQIEGGIGAIASRLTAQGPIVRNKSSFLVAGRRTYAFDLAQPFIRNTAFNGTNYHFYDLNTKLFWQVSEKDQLYFSGYFGKDVLRYVSNVRDIDFFLPYGNQLASLRWNHIFHSKLSADATLSFNAYDFGFEAKQSEYVINLFSGIRDWNAKLDFDYFPDERHEIGFGIHYTFHELIPNVASATNGEIDFSNQLTSQFANEGALYLQDEWSPTSWLRLQLGLRGSWFQQLGPYTSKVDGRQYEQGEPVTSYSALEPRFSSAFLLNENLSVKTAITRSNQYLHLVSNSTSTLPFDIWVPTTERIRPQQGWQYAAGVFQNFDDGWEVAVEGFYKQLDNQIDYGENYVNNVADDLENEFVFGRGTAYGVEFFLQKSQGKFTGWLGYTWSRTTRQFDDINDGKPFPAVYDRTHDLSIVANYEFNDRWDAGMVFVYGTGNAFTPVQSLYFIEQKLNWEYGTRNSARIQPYHRFDLSARFFPKGREAEGRFQSHWSFSIYNVYSRQNPFFVYYAVNTDLETNSATATAYKVALFPIIPSVTWNFKWGG